MKVPLGDILILNQKLLKHVNVCVLDSYFYVFNVTVYYVREYLKEKNKTSKSGYLEILASW